MRRILRPVSKAVLCAALWSAASATLAATVTLDFGEGGLIAPPTFAPPYSEDDFDLTTIAHNAPGEPDDDHFDIMNALPGSNLGPNGEREAVIHTGNDGDEVIISFRGAPFALISLEIEDLKNSNTGGWEVVGSNGAQLTVTSTGILTFDSAWADLLSVTLRATSVPAQSDFSGYLTFDNVVLDTAPVPVPPSALMFLGAAAVLVPLRRRAAGR
jgi:hypothetical protein